MTKIIPEIQIKINCSKCKKNNFMQWIPITNLNVDIDCVPSEDNSLNPISVAIPGDWFDHDNIRQLLIEKRITEKTYHDHTWGWYALICPDCIKELPIK